MPVETKFESDAANQTESASTKFVDFDTPELKNRILEEIHRHVTEVMAQNPGEMACTFTSFMMNVKPPVYDKPL